MSKKTTDSPISAQSTESIWTVFWVFLRLGLTSFGGPIAHLGYFRDEFVIKRQWLSESRYADLVALCQFLPGPASSQVGIAVGFYRARSLGAIVAWLGFTLPSALVLILFALGLKQFADVMPIGVWQGFKIVAVAVVAQAVWGMGKKLTPDAPRLTLMAIATAIVLLLPSVWTQVGVIVLAAIVGIVFMKPIANQESAMPIASGKRRFGAVALLVFVLLLVTLPIMANSLESQTLSLVDAFYRSGSLVFGGGHVVLPLLQAEVVPTGWVNHETFLAGYGITQAVPGPLFTFAAFLGASMNQNPTGWLGGMIALVAIFLPSFLLVLGALPFWETLRNNVLMQKALLGINAVVVGILLAALYDPVWTSAIHSSKDFSLAIVALIALMVWKVPPWLVVLVSGIAGALIF